MRTFVLFSFFTLFAPAVFANIPGLEATYSRMLGRTQATIVQKGLVPQTRPETCHRQALKIREDGQINIFVAFGYMDVSGGQDFEDSGMSLYGNGDVLDSDAKKALVGRLKTRCPSGQDSMACGFKGNGNSLRKTIRDRWSNSRIRVNIVLASPSVTSSDAANKGQYASRQQSSSAQVKNQFLGALQSYDAVIYMGHARSGGGPDFLPPVLYSSGAVNYSHYRSQQDGIRSMLGALSSNSAPVIGVLACKSTGLFASRIRRRAPNSLLVTADELFDYNDILPTGYAMIEGLVSQSCTDEFERITKVQPASRRFLTVFY
jgi:hypothetical protein